MPLTQADLGRPIRVVLFCGGPTLDRAVIRFIARLESEAEIEFVGGFSQTAGRSFAALIGDRFRRRGVLACALLAAEALATLGRVVLHPRSELALWRRWKSIASRVIPVPDMHAEPVLRQVRALNADLGLIYGGPILKPQLFQIPRLGTLGIHHGKMPQYRGKKTTFWAMYNGEETAGVTIQMVNEGVDTGQIIQRGEVRIGRKSMPTVKRELEELGFALYVKAILDLKRGVARLAPATGPKGKLYKDPVPSDFVRFWWRQLRGRRYVASG